MANSNGTSEIKIGDRVAYSANWLRSMGIFSGELPFLRGSVKELEDLGGITIATIIWEGYDHDSIINLANLIREDRIPYQL